MVTSDGIPGKASGGSYAAQLTNENLCCRLYCCCTGHQTSSKDIKDDGRGGIYLFIYFDLELRLFFSGVDDVLICYKAFYFTFFFFFF